MTDEQVPGQTMAFPDPLAPAPADPCALGVLRHMRLDAQLSLRELAELTGINKGRLSIIERGALATPNELHTILDAIYETQTTWACAAPGTQPTASWTRHDG